MLCKIINRRAWLRVASLVALLVLVSARLWPAVAQDTVIQDTQDTTQDTAMQETATQGTVIPAERVVLSPRSLVRNPLPRFEVQVFVDKDVSGESIVSYNANENIRISVRAEEDSFLYLFNVSSSNDIIQLIPNRLDQAGQDNRIRAGETTTFPPANARYTWDVGDVLGLEKIIAIVSQDEINTFELASFGSDPNFATSSLGEATFARTLAELLRPLESSRWASDTVLFYVGPRPATLPFGTLQVTSEPGGARVEVDGRFAGFTPLRYGAETGTRTVDVALEGFNSFSTAVTISGGQSSRVEAALTAVEAVRGGTATFESTPPGAQVFVNGELVGVTPTQAISFAEGSYEARFQLEGYSDASINFGVSRNLNQIVETQLVAAAPDVERVGALIVEANIVGARVFVNGQDYGTIPNSLRGRVSNLPQGTHQLTVVAQGYETFVQDFSISAGETTSLEVTQTQRP